MPPKKKFLLHDRRNSLIINLLRSMLQFKSELNGISRLEQVHIAAGLHANGYANSSEYLVYNHTVRFIHIALQAAKLKYFIIFNST